MRYVQINEYSHGWAESIVFGKHKELLEEGVESYVFWGRGRNPENDWEMRITTLPEVCIDAALTRMDGRAGFHSHGATKRLLRKLDDIDPDVVHLHVLHGYYLNIEMLFGWLASHRCDVIWTLHDCWPFTGHCQYFTAVGCDEWKTGCSGRLSCPQTSSYPQTYNKRNVARNYRDKKRLFTSIPPSRMRLIVPSNWLAGLVRESFLSKYQVSVVRNKVDLSVFKPTPSDFRERYGIGNRFLILGVANAWTERKGLSDFVQLAQGLDPNKYAIVLIGLNANQIRRLGNLIIGIERTRSAKELAEAYTAADVLFNPTKEDNYPTVNLEAQSCGTAVGTYRTGGSPETLYLEESFVCSDLNCFIQKCHEMSLLGDSICRSSSAVVEDVN